MLFEFEIQTWDAHQHKSILKVQKLGFREQRNDYAKLNISRSIAPQPQALLEAAGAGQSR